ncbi:hypothetical protein [Loigolactobacillus jiayinensis]|uniref:Uncharacterized protein n=1 Tax=Loigolactobacillus jiayinensis TaxID=2486016 RepID=A0ABW1RBX9_9LACO|nr:hypothetical protein [Loigolactobacillus jiayinensis]
MESYSVYDSEGNFIDDFEDYDTAEKYANALVDSGGLDQDYEIIEMKNRA